MLPFVRGFLRSALVWLAVGGLLGLDFLVRPGDLVYRSAHVHATLLGFVSLFIFGVAYHVIPRFTGRPLRSVRAAVWHLWLGNVGVAGLVAGWLARPSWPAAGGALLLAGGAASGLGGALFIWNLWSMLGPPDRAAARPSGRGS